jgi:acyl-CoA synthetase (AMP-forming)/AMP-acid ligase II/ubiquinone/menaquinone biosynthesis C-methylase UbiE
MFMTDKRPGDAIITGPWAAPPVPKLSLPRFVMRDWARFGDKPGVIDAPSGRSVSYRELAAAVRDAASTLKATGLATGDVLALCCPNSPEFVITFYGALMAGAVVSTMSLDVSETEAVAQLKDCDARWVATTPQLASMLSRAAAAGSTQLLVVGDHHSGRHASQQMPAIAPQQLAVLLRSSGTTGLPKSVMLTHRNLVAGLVGLRAPEPVSREDVVLAALPLCHIAGLQVVLGPALSAGATVVTLPKFDLEAFLAAIERYRVTRIVVAPPIVLALAKHSLVDRYDLSSLQTLASGAAPLGGELARAAARRVGCQIRQGYGMTEAGAICMAPADGPDRPESIGPPLPGVECRIVDPATGADLAPGQAGELLARSPAQMRGYLGNEAATAATIDTDGWLHTGDIVRADPDGWLHVVDRVKELIKYKGRQVAPAELEQILLSHPAVADAAVIGCPDHEAGEIPAAFVVTRHRVDPAELLAYVATRVSPHKRIRRLEFVGEIPKSASGKILRRALKEHARPGSAPNRHRRLQPQADPTGVRTPRGFEHVDETGDVPTFASYCDAVAPILSAQKKTSIAALALQPGQAALDLGCGTGAEVRQIADIVGPCGRAVGVDMSQGLLAEARARTASRATVEYVACDAHALAFSDGEFDAAREERMLQHVADPAAVIAEMARVVRPGGRVVAMEPDWYTLVFSGDDTATAQAIATEIARHIRNPAAGRSLLAWLTEAGLTVTQLEASAVAIRNYEAIRRLLLVDETVDRLNSATADAWREQLRHHDKRGTLIATMTGFIAVATVPTPHLQRPRHPIPKGPQGERRDRNARRHARYRADTGTANSGNELRGSVRPSV